MRRRGHSGGWRRLAALSGWLAWALPAAVTAQDAPAAATATAEIEALELLEQRRPSAATAPAALRLAGAWLLRGEWLAAAELLQESAELADALEQPEVGRAARSRIAAVDRLLLRPAADRERWPTARVLRPSQIELRRPVAVAARGDGELLVVDEARDRLARISESEGLERTRSAPKARKPAWGPGGEALLTYKDGTTRELDGSTRPWPPRGLGEPLDVARDAAGRWLVLTSGGRVLRAAADGTGRQTLELPRLVEPIALDTDPLGNLYIVEEGAVRVLVVDRTGRTIDVVGPGLPGGLALRRPLDVAADDSGRLYIVDRRLGVVVLE